MRTSSAKAKGRRLQQAVAAAIRERFHLAPDDVRPAIMGESGEDIKLSTAARAVFPFAVECKNQERLNVWDAIQQTEANAERGCPLLVFKRNRTRTYVVIDFDSFLDLAESANAGSDAPPGDGAGLAGGT